MYGFDNGKNKESEIKLTCLDVLTFKAENATIVKAHWECPKCLNWYEAKGTDPKVAYYCPNCLPTRDGIRPIVQLISDKPKTTLTTQKLNK